MRRLWRAALAPLVCSLLAAAPSPSPSPVCLPPGIEKTDDTPVPLTGQQLKDYATGLNTPEVIGMRAAFDAFESGHADAVTARTLKPYRALVNSRFFVWKMDSASAGSEIYQILFRDHMDAVYRVWIFQLPNGHWQVRQLAAIPCTQAQVQWIVHKYRRIFTGRFDA